MTIRQLVSGLVLASLASLPATAAVDWHEWQDEGFQAAVDEAARSRRLVALVVTQPDWCPPCIRLNAKWLNNPDDVEVSPLLKEAMLLEVLGYDPPGAELLRAQGLKFQGTPSLLVFRPTVPGDRLGSAELVGSIVGAPADYPERLRAIVSGHQPVRSVRRKLLMQRDPVERARLSLELADLHVARGDAAAAVRALRGVREARRSARGLSAEGSGELDRLVREAEWKRAASVELRVNKDYEAALTGIDAWLGRHGRAGGDPEDIAYARAWALAHLGRTDEARAEMTGTFLAPGADGLSTYAYFAFRVGEAGLLRDAEVRLRAALEADGSSAGAHGALGRVLRKQGRHREAVASFARAVELAEGDAQVSWRGQLDYCRAELLAASTG